jgi:exodeoxyribonuclease-3
LNIAPLENDVWSHKQLLNVVSHTPLETSLLLEIINSGEWVDVMREIIPHEEKLYSWWSYRNRNWETSNRGRRLDHVWVSKNLFSKVKSGVIYKDTRNWERPSDHVPIIIDINI